MANFPFVIFSPSQIPSSGTTMATITIDPNGLALSAATVVFEIVPEQIHLVSVTGANGFSASGIPGGSNFSFGISFGQDQTTPIVAGTAQLQGLIVGGQLQLVHQAYTDSQFNDLVVDTPIVVATVVSSGG